MIRHWVEADGRRQPRVHSTPEAAEASVHGEIVAPPVMLQAWVHAGRSSPRAPGRRQRTQTSLLNLLDERRASPPSSPPTASRSTSGSCTSATTCRRPTIIETVSDEKATGLGVGHFVTTRIEYRDQDGELVGTMTVPHPQVQAGHRPKAAARSRRSSGAAAATSARRNPGQRVLLRGRQGAPKLLIQRCTSCGTLRHPPGPMCPSAGPTSGTSSRPPATAPSTASW